MSLVEQCPWDTVRIIIMFGNFPSLIGFYNLNKYFKHQIKSDRKLMIHFCFLIRVVACSSWRRKLFAETVNKYIVVKGLIILYI